MQRLKLILFDMLEGQRISEMQISLKSIKNNFIVTSMEFDLHNDVL